MTEGSSPRSELQHALYSGCRQWLVLLSEFVAMHTTIDAPAQQASDVNTDISFRLRKAYFHVDAILAWPIDTLIVHVMGPEIRTALRYLEPIVSEFLQDSVQRQRSDRTARASRDFKYTAECLGPSDDADIDPISVSGRVGSWRIDPMPRRAIRPARQADHQLRRCA